MYGLDIYIFSTVPIWLTVWIDRIPHPLYRPHFSLYLYRREAKYNIVYRGVNDKTCQFPDYASFHEISTIYLYKLLVWNPYERCGSIFLIKRTANVKEIGLITNKLQVKEYFLYIKKKNHGNYPIH